MVDVPAETMSVAVRWAIECAVVVDDPARAISEIEVDRSVPLAATVIAVRVDVVWLGHGDVLTAAAIAPRRGLIGRVSPLSVRTLPSTRRVGRELPLSPEMPEDR